MSRAPLIAAMKAAGFATVIVNLLIRPSFAAPSGCHWLPGPPKGP